MRNWSVEVCLAVWLAAAFAASGLGLSFGGGLAVGSVAFGPTGQWCVFFRLFAWKV